MTMTKVLIRNGIYGNKEINDLEFETVDATVKKGKKGLFVTVNGQPIGVSRNIRVLVESEDDVVFDGADVAHKETDEEIIERLREKFEVLDTMTHATCMGHVCALIVSGPPGVGKSFGIEKVLDEYQMINKMCDDNRAESPKYGMEKVASTSPVGLYQLLWEYRNKGSVLVLDDSDSVLYDEATINMLKAATDSGKRRRLTWRTESRVLTNNGIPDSFDFKGAIIFVTNLDFEKGRGRIGEHLKAILSRCHYLDVGIKSTHEKFLRCKQIVLDGMLRDYGFTSQELDEILDYVKTNQKNLRELSLRMVKKIADLARMDRKNWRRLANQTCIKT